MDNYIFKKINEGFDREKRVLTFTKLRRERCDVFSLAYESPCIINISKNYTQKKLIFNTT